MGAEGLEPSRPLGSTDFHPPPTFAGGSVPLENRTLPLPTKRLGCTAFARVAPVESLHLPKGDCRSAWLRIAISTAVELGFPEFESIHLWDFSRKAQ